MSAQAALSNESWKSKYYDQLDNLEKKEKAWTELESVLRRAIGRLSLAAKGQSDAIDRRINDIRVAIKDPVDTYRLQTTLDDLSKVLAQAKLDRVITRVLHNLVEGVALPVDCESRKTKLLKRLSTENDDASESLLRDTIALLTKALSVGPGSQEKKPGLLDRLLGGTPSEINDEKEKECVDSAKLELEAYRNSMILLLDKFGEEAAPAENISVLRAKAGDAMGKNELDQLSSELISLLEKNRDYKNNIDHSNPSDRETQPGTQKLLTRFLDQLSVPAEFSDKVAEIKTRLKSETASSDWNRLLRDIAALINSIRGHLHREKHDFEEFLKQVTARLKELDGFLLNENTSISQAEKEGDAFDRKMNSRVSDIRDDMHQAVDLETLKCNVEGKLDHISQHIKHYRETEQMRYSAARHDILAMQEKVTLLEKETKTLRDEVENKNKLAMFDALTGLPNRLAYEIRSEEEVARWQRFGNPLAMAIWDIDHFKKVNDMYGHKAGDKGLVMVAKVLRENIRETDFLARLGGEEFIMLLPNTEADGALKLAEQLRQKIQDCAFHYKGESVDITVSCGISVFKDNGFPAGVFEQADKALYRAKESGRNQCILAPE